MSPKRKRKKLQVRTRTPRPDELSRDAFQFITDIDTYKRRNMRSFLEDREVLQILFTMGYRAPDSGAQPTAAELARYAAARQRYRVEHGRLFPTWSEVFEILEGLGYRRIETDRAA